MDTTSRQPPRSEQASTLSPPGFGSEGTHPAQLPPVVIPPGGAAFVVDRDLRYVMAEGEALRNAQLRPEDLVGKTVAQALEPALAAIAEPYYRQALVGVPFTHEHHSTCGRWYLSQGVPLRDARGQVYGVLAVSYDITERKQLEPLEQALRDHAARQAFLLELSDALRPLAEAVEIQSAVLRVLGEHLGVSRALYVEVLDEREVTISRDYANGVASIAGRHPAESFGTVAIQALEHGEPLVIDDVATDPRLSESERQAFRALDVAAAMGIGLRQDGRLVAGLWVHSVTPRTWTALERQSLQDASERTWAVVERARAESALRASEERMRRAAAAARVFTWDADLTARTLHVSDTGEEILGLALPTNLDDAMAALYHRDDLARVVAEFSVAVQRGGDFEFDFRNARSRSGAEQWLRATGSVMKNADGQPVRAIGVTQDITERRRTEAALRESEARQTFLLKLSDAMRPLADPIAIQGEAARLLAERVGAHRVAYFEVRGTDYVVERDYTSDVASVAGSYPIEWFGSWLLETYRAGRTAVVSEVATDPHLTPSERSAYAAIDIGAHIGVPLVKAGQLVAGLAVHMRDPRQWTANEVAMAEATAERTWAAVERARSEEALRAAHKTFRHLVEHSPFGVYAVDADFRLVQVSAGAQKVFENIRPLIGRDYAEVLHILWDEPFASEAIGHFRHTLATGEPYHAPATVERRSDSGHVESYDWKIERIVMPDGRFGVVCHFYDLSERQKYEDALRAADRQKDDFIAVLAHELRNPLAPMRMSVGLLHARGADDPVVVQCRDVIDRQVAHLTRLLDDLLDVSRLSQGKLTLQPQDTLLKDVLDGAIETVRPLLIRGGHRLTIESPAEPIRLHADSARLIQVFANVLGNAAKFTDAEGQISVTVRPVDGEVAVTIADTGIGIATDMVDRVFDLFTQADVARARGEGGLGIGLALARQLVEMHGGTIRCDSDGLGTGSRFTVNLPIRKAPPSSLPLVDHGMPACLGRRVLVVDDNHDAADMTAALLEHHGCDVRAVYSGEAAIETARTFQPQLVLLDLGMPGMDGWETCRRLRSQPWGSEVVIAAVTGWGQEEDRRATTHAGFDHHLVKPVDPNALMRLMEERKP